MTKTKDEREILTKEKIRRKLVREAQQSVVGTILMLFMGSLFFGVTYLMFSMAESSNKGIVLTIEGVLAVLFAVVCLSSLVRSVMRLIKAQRGEFSVVEEALTDIQANQFSLRHFFLNLWLNLPSIIHRDNWFIHIFAFESGKQFIANSGEYRNTGLGVTAQIASAGDRYYTVFYNDSPEKIVWLYSTKLCNYKE